jgi:hypothetical protein
MNGSEAIICPYLAGLTLLALAVMAAWAGRDHQRRPSCLWLAGLALAQAAVSWSELLSNFTARLWITGGLQAVACVASCVAVVELGRHLAECRSPWFLGRWAYGILGVLGLLAVVAGKSSWLFDGYCAVLAWQGGVIGVTLLTQSLVNPQSDLGRAAKGTVAALLVYLATFCLQLTLLSTLALLAAASCAWLMQHGPDLAVARGKRLQASLGPAVFLVAAVAGSVVLLRSGALAENLAWIGNSAGTGDAAGDGNPSPEAGSDSGATDDGASHDAASGDSADADAADEGGGYSTLESIAASPELRRFGLAVIPIVAFVLIILVLSRLPLAS